MVSTVQLLASKLSSYGPRGIKPGLEQIKTLLQLLGNPEGQVPFLHVAGTNGKGSVCAYLGSILAQGGYRVGVFTSPHLISWTERFQINGQAIKEEELLAIIERIESAIAQGEVAVQPTHFELLTAVAWVYFAQERVDLAVIEVGLGGRLDCTNVKDDPLVSIITSIGFDHCEILGQTLPEIAREKAGIIKPGCPAIASSTIPTAAKQAIEDYGQTLGNPIQWIDPLPNLKGQFPYGNNCYPLPLPGNHQLINLSLAIAAIETLQPHWPVDSEALVAGIKATRWPGRLQWSHYQGHPLLIDGAHNPEAASCLRAYADQLTGPIHWIVGILATKDAREILAIIVKPEDHLYFVPIPDAHCHLPQELMAMAPSIPCASMAPYATVELALRAAMTEEGTLVLCGSLYLIGYFLSHYGSN